MYTEKNKILILGNGPSLKKEYFNLFTDVDTLGMNAAYRYWRRINWYPTVYSCLDDQVIISHAEEIYKLIFEDRCEHFFLHQDILNLYPSLKNRGNVVFLPQMLFGEKHKATCHAYKLEHMPSESFRTEFGSKLTTGSYSVRFASHLGYAQIGLVGIDCRYTEIIPEARKVEGNILRIQETPEKNSNYFFEDYQKAGDVYNVPNPSVHKGNLHLQSFEAIRSDIKTFNIPITVKTCTTESELSIQNIFEYVPIKTFVGGRQLTAIFMPFTRPDIPKILDRFRIWGRRGGIPPYKSIPDSPSVELHLAFNKTHDVALERKLTEVFNAEGLSRYFSGLSFHYSDLEGLRDLYARGGGEPHGPEGYMAGPNNQFFDIIEKFSRGMSHIAVMEADVAPIRSGWLEKLERIVEHSEKFWICGSHYRGVAHIQALWHVNGNAIYNVGDSDFIDFIETHFRNAFYDRVNKFPRTSYDIVLHHMFRDISSGKADGEVRELWSRCAHRIQFSEFIVDLSHDEDRKLENLLSLEAARRRFRDAFLVHGAVATIDNELTGRVTDGGALPVERAAIDGRSDDQPIDVVLVDPDAINWFGHYMAYNDKLTEALREQGHTVKVLCNVNLAEEIREQRNNFLPRLTTESRFIGKEFNNEEQIAKFKSEIRSALNEIYSGDKCVLYMYCGSFCHAEILGEQLERFQNLYANVNLFYEAFEECDTPEWAKRWRLAAPKLVSASPRLKVTVPTKRLQQKIAQVTGVSFEIAPHPSTAISDSDFHCGILASPESKEQVPPPARLRVLFPGSTRRGKGFDTALGVATTIASLPETEVVLRYANPEEARKYRPLIERLDASVQIVEGELSNDDYLALFASAHVSVLLYDPVAFAHRTSGLLIDSLYHGLPVVTLRGSWLGGVVERFGCGIAIESGSEKAVAAAVAQIRADYAAYRECAIQGARAYFEHNSWKRLALSITAIDSNKIAAELSESVASLEAMTGGKRMLIIGNGPSTAELVKHGLENIPVDVDTFGMGAAYRFFREVSWWPTYYALADSKVVHSHRHELKALIEDETIPTKKFYFSRSLSKNPRFELIPHSSTGDFCFRKAIELGYREIYLIGVEGSYVEEIAESRPLTNEEFKEFGFDELNLPENLRKLLIIDNTPAKNPNYFFDYYQKKGDVYSLPQSKAHQAGWKKSFAAVEGLENCSVYNLSALSKIDIFPRRSLEDFFAGRSSGTNEHPREARLSVDETSVIANLLTKRTGRSHVMLDVGAHFGTSAAYFDALGWTIHCFEPDPKNREKLVRRFGKKDNLTIDTRAVSDKPAEGVAFFQSDESTGISGLHAFRDTHKEMYKVDVTTVAEIVEKRGINHIDFLKIDVEGFDFSVLKGVPWDRLKPDVIECEYEDAKTVSMGHTWRDIAEFLREKGYAVYVSEWHPIIRYGTAHDWRRVVPYPGVDIPPDSWGNLLAFRKDPGYAAVSEAFKILVKRRSEQAAKPTPETASKTHAAPQSRNNGISVPNRAPDKTTPETAGKTHASLSRNNGVSVPSRAAAHVTAALPALRAEPERPFYADFGEWLMPRAPHLFSMLQHGRRSLVRVPERLDSAYGHFALGVRERSSVLFRLGQMTVWSLRAARRHKLFTFGLIIVSALLTALPFLLALAWTYRFWIWGGAGLGGLALAGGAVAAIMHEAFRRVVAAQDAALNSAIRATRARVEQRYIELQKHLALQKTAAEEHLAAQNVAAFEDRVEALQERLAEHKAAFEKRTEALAAENRMTRQVMESEVEALKAELQTTARKAEAGDGEIRAVIEEIKTSQAEERRAFKADLALARNLQTQRQADLKDLQNRYRLVLREKERQESVLRQLTERLTLAVQYLPQLASPQQGEVDLQAAPLHNVSKKRGRSRESGKATNKG